MFRELDPIAPAFSPGRRLSLLLGRPATSVEGPARGMTERCGTEFDHLLSAFETLLPSFITPLTEGGSVEKVRSGILMSSFYP